MTDRIPLGDLTSDQLDALYEQLEAAEETELARRLAVCDEAFASAAVRAAQAEQRAVQAEAAIERVRRLHQPAPGGSGGLSFNSGARCAECDQMYRCTTIRTLDEQQPTTTETTL
ncbi:hypothetical protein ACFYNF_34445 [Streptomyces sp. NPDC006641]|uniref:hypothetical protein n=1 Tax=unclassified Streptomyces TaxID=2593676 RepID=UPI003698E886